MPSAKELSGWMDEMKTLLESATFEIYRSDIYSNGRSLNKFSFEEDKQGILSYAQGDDILTLSNS
jgi:hypothetical protein